jgi:hypothetical protein
VTFETEGGGLVAGENGNFFVAIELNEGAEFLGVQKWMRNFR